ncbi:GtrA family protein [uncultured Lamprocystis sp.]|jgi:putative flippase GtrA|uniref:GtrA family protein n=1 Tax=uncultured Lamprocystis sp. TaxID=543132 RepID=UPI0025F3D086|nr:GtrA family protein [uncultured Lamprocystis sp.]
MLTPSEFRALGRFTLVGATGFVIDAGILTLLAQGVALNIYIARLFSFAGAVLATWALNRAFVFTAKAAVRSRATTATELAQYLLVQSGGAAVNLALFAGQIMVWPMLRDYPVIPLAVASVLALIVNFIGMRLWVFGGVRKRSESA